MLEGLGFNLCVMPFLTSISLISLKEEVKDGQRWLELGQRYCMKYRLEGTKSEEQ